MREMREDVADAVRIRQAEMGPRRRRRAMMPEPRERIPFEVVAALMAGAMPLTVWRRHRKLSPASLAAAIGSVSVARLRAIEAGREPLSRRLQMIIAALLRIDPEDLEPWDGADGGDRWPPIIADDDDSAELREEP